MKIIDYASGIRLLDPITIQFGDGYGRPTKEVFYEPGVYPLSSDRKQIIFSPDHTSSITSFELDLMKVKYEYVFGNTEEIKEKASQ